MCRDTALLAIKIICLIFVIAKKIPKTTVGAFKGFPMNRAIHSQSSTYLQGTRWTTQRLYASVASDVVNNPEVQAAASIYIEMALERGLNYEIALTKTIGWLVSFSDLVSMVDVSVALDKSESWLNACFSFLEEVDHPSFESTKGITKFVETKSENWLRFATKASESGLDIQLISQKNENWIKKLILLHSTIDDSDNGWWESLLDAFNAGVDIDIDRVIVSANKTSVIANLN